MVKVEHNACLSTSLSPSKAPGSDSVNKTESEAKDKATARRPDYVVAIAYVMIYLEVGWLIFVLLRMYSRD